IVLLANAWHHRSDALSSLAAAVGLAAVAVGGRKWAFMDPLTAMVLGTFLLTVAVRIMRTSAAELIDRAPAQKTLDGIELAVARTQGVISYHAVRARQVGGKIAMDIHVQVDPELTVRAGHDIAGAVRRRVMEADSSVIETIVHIEPFEGKAAGSAP
ncbi:MAG: cation diffusion facilitator family transporter, partial [Planctomycetes bacterium]|nr:cation diffusion facilitator family transporter [Planctomycetota bacterium]